MEKVATSIALKILVYDAEHIREKCEKEMKKIKNKQFKETLQLYLNLCECCKEKKRIEPKVREGFSEAFLNAKNISEANDLAIDYITNYEEYMEELFLEIERLKDKIKNN